MVTRRHVILGAGALTAAGALGTAPLRAQQNYPNKPVKIIVANPPGGDDDTLSRFIAQAITADLGQPVIVENRGGGATTIGGTAVAQSAPDGHTLLCVHMASIIQTVLRDKLQYSMKSFVPIIGIGGYPMALVISPKSAIKSLDDLKAAASKGDGITFASAGAGTLAHLTTVRFLKAIEGKGVHVAYKNNPEGLQALAGGFTEMMFPSAREAANLSKDGLVRVLAVTSKVRANNLPDTPTMIELGLPQIDSRLWYSYVAPAGTPPEIVNRLAEVVEKTVKTPAFTERFHPVSFQTDVIKGEPLQQFIDTQATRFRELIVENNIKFTD
jgi:tripartite-type tricarboxylate transporter receptor subunit TctC